MTPLENSAGVVWTGPAGWPHRFKLHPVFVTVNVNTGQRITNPIPNMAALLEALPDRPTEALKTLSNLPEDIIKEILLMLPVKSLLKFRCVSKSWLSLISSPQFVKAHFEFSPDSLISPVVVVHNLLGRPTIVPNCVPFAFYTFTLSPNRDGNASVDTVPLDRPLRNPFQRRKVVGSCNGLVCLAFGNTIILWNPSTRKSGELQASPNVPFDFSVIDLVFGYDESKDDYKVVKFYLDEGYSDEEESEIEMEPILPSVQVYSSRAHSWRNVECNYKKSWGDRGVFANGAIYWLVHCKGEKAIVALDMATETCTTVAHPNCEKLDDVKETLLGISKGRICLSYIHGELIEIWRLEEYWTRVVNVYFSPNVEYNICSIPLIASNREGIILEGDSYLIICKGSLVYKIELHKPSIYDDMRKSFHLQTGATVYRESLFSPISE